MASFIVLLILSLAAFFVSTLISSKMASSRIAGGSAPLALLRALARFGSIAILVLAVVKTSMIRVPDEHFGTFRRVFAGRIMSKPGQKIALPGEIGPQAEIRYPGWYFSPLISLINDIEYVPNFIVPPGKCAILSAADGQASAGAPFAPPWPEEHRMRMANDAAFFLTEGGGYRGQQTTVLFPGSYTLNPFLWGQGANIKIVDATKIEQGTVGVIKSFVRGPVNFGNFARPVAEDDTLKVLTKDALPDGAMQTPLVPVGAVGVWEEPLLNGLYFVNTDAYVVTKCPVIEFPVEYKGGYKKRTADLDVDKQGQITSVITSEDVPVPVGADPAIVTKVEGFEIPLEARALVQIAPMYAPFVVAGLGLVQDASSSETATTVETRVVSPVLRSSTRNVTGGTTMTFESKEMVLVDNKPTIGPNGEIVTRVVTSVRLPKVLDFIENRATIEKEILLSAKADALRQGITINEFRLAEAVVPAEMLAARKRELLSAQLVKSWTAEELAQKQRQAKENAFATAEQQTTLVTAEMLNKAAEQKKMARMMEAEGEKGYLLAVAEGQSAQMKVLGADQTARLQMFSQSLKMIQDVLKDNPTLVADMAKLAPKFVPTIQVNSGGGNAGLDLNAASVLFGALTNPTAVPELEKLNLTPPATASVPAGQ